MTAAEIRLLPPLPAVMALAIAMAISACSLARPHGSATGLRPLPPSTLGSSRSVRQVVHGAFGEHEVVFQFVVDAAPDHVTVVGLGALGQRWFSLRFDGNALESEISPQAPESLEPPRVLVDLQLALWPLAAWQQALAGSEWQLTEATPATRRLWRAGRLVTEIHYTNSDPWQGRLWLSNFELGYALTVESQALP